MPALFTPKIRLVRKPPIGARNVRAVIKKEMVDALERIMWPAVKSDLNAMWPFNPPFKHRIFTPRSGFKFRVYVDMRTTLGKRFWWSDRGTGLEGPSKAKYPIPKTGMAIMKFVVPYQPFTDSITPMRYNPGAPPKFITTRLIMHPGIQHRGFSKSIKMGFEHHGHPKGVFRVTKAAYQRAFDKLK